METPRRAQPHIAMFPTPGKGHLFPLVELARKLIQLHSFTITCIIPDDGSHIKPQKDLLQTCPAINSIFLPPVSCDDLPENVPIERRIVVSVIRSIPALCEVLSELKESTSLSAFVGDIFGSFTFEAVKELGIPSYMFYTSGAMVLSFAFYLPELDESCTCEYRDLPEPLKLPGCVPVHGSDFVDPIQDRKTETYKVCVDLCKKFTLAEGVMVNSFLELEPGALKALEQGGGSRTRTPVYPVGPLIRSDSGTGSCHDKAECLKWLDKQPAGSVLYVSFGSGGTLSSEQLKELASGLERSEQRFLWVARRPNDKVRNAAYFSGDEHKMDPCDYLSTDFMENTKGKGFVLPEWAPQVEVLSHAAVGGFLTHCGWNSTLESIVHGVPLIAWPLFAEQRMNAVLLSEDLKVALRVRENENGVVEGEQISRLARSLIKGEEGAQLRNRMRDLKDAAARAFGEDGSSAKALAYVAEKWK